jgi:hypothetical protein
MTVAMIDLPMLIICPRGRLELASLQKPGGCNAPTAFTEADAHESISLSKGSYDHFISVFEKGSCLAGGKQNGMGASFCEF